MNAEKVGLVVITLERYVKVVHAVAHRKYYRNWMTTVGVVVPWIAGFSTVLIPALLTTREVAGQCPRMGFGERKDSEKVRKQSRASGV